MGKNRFVLTESLNQEWGNYSRSFHQLSSDERAEFLTRQGYACFADLLAHFTAWWERGMQIIQTLQTDPDYQPPEVDVDAFNAAAIARVNQLSEEAVIQQFEAARLKFLDLANRLTDEEYLNPKIARQLEMELIGHLQEHAIKPAKN